MVCGPVVLSRAWTTTARSVGQGSAGALDIGAALAYTGPAGSANVGVPMGNCYGKGNSCNSKGTSFLDHFDWSLASTANAATALNTDVRRDR